jgi:drug/metabolite transporter (DMT)-like permease
VSPLTAVAAAVGAALMLGIASVADQRSTKRVKHRRALSPRILVDLARQPLWLTAVAANVAGFALQVVALDFGSLAVVQPVLACDLIFAVLILWFLRRPASQRAGGGSAGKQAMITRCS